MHDACQTKNGYPAFAEYDENILVERETALNHFHKLPKVLYRPRQGSRQAFIWHCAAFQAHRLKTKLRGRMRIPAITGYKTYGRRIMDGKLLHGQTVNAAAGLIDAHIFNGNDMIKQLVQTSIAHQ